MSQVRLHIDALALYGVPPEEAAAVVAGLKSELTARFSQSPPQAAVVPSIQGALPAASGDALGRAAGVAISRGIRS